ncbi:MAG: acyl carrier protein [Veillonellaceae bacterium]|nr:acyl carrier protein [Veillonellaceae bacterium]
MEKNEVAAKLRDIIAGRIDGIDPAGMNDDTELAALGADSLALSWIMADVEDTFDFVMRGGELMKLKTFAAFVDYVVQRVGK